MKNLVAYVIIAAVIIFAAGNIKYPAKSSASASTPSLHTMVKISHVPTVLAGTFSIYGPATISASQINIIFTAYHSPAAGTGSYLYRSALQYGIDPIVPLAFFMHESTLGTQGEATATLALGNERCLTDRPCIDSNRGGYAQFESWNDGYEHWFDLLTGPVYKGTGLTTIQQIIPVYAPAADRNDEQAYIASLIYSINAWRAGKVVI